MEALGNSQNRGGTQRQDRNKGKQPSKNNHKHSISSWLEFLTHWLSILFDLWMTNQWTWSYLLWYSAWTTLKEKKENMLHGRSWPQNSLFLGFIAWKYWSYL